MQPRKPELYPEVVAAGGLSQAIDNAFIAIGSLLRTKNEDGKLNPPFAYARVEAGKKFSQIYIAAKEKLFMTDYWRDGVCLGQGSIDKLELLVASIDYWLFSNDNTSELAKKFAFVSVSEKAAVFDANDEVAYSWEGIANDPWHTNLKEFVTLALQDEVLRTLFPFTSLDRLCFSRCTGYPYTYDAPIVVPIPGGKFDVRMDDHSVGIGGPDEALVLVKQHLPIGIQPAVKGTAEDL